MRQYNPLDLLQSCHSFIAGTEYYVTDEKTEYSGINSNCRLATPKVRLLVEGILAIEDDSISLSKVKDELWVGYKQAFGIFQYIGRTIAL